MPTIDADGCPIHVEIEGPDRAPTVIFSNSLGTNLHMWDEQAKHLSRKFRVVRYDQRGHGKSGAPKMPYTLERLGKDVIAILDSLKIERAHFCGLSMGGFTGMWLGRLAPKRIGKLVLSNTGAKMPICSPSAFHEVLLCTLMYKSLPDAGGPDERRSATVGAVCSSTG